MAPRVCLGSVANAEGEAADPCVFNGNGTGRPARALTHGRCVWCCPEEMNRRLASPKLEKFLIYTLVNFRGADGEVFEKATRRLPEQRRADILAEVDARLVPEEEDVEMAPAAEEAEGESEEEETQGRGPERFAELGLVADDPGEEEGQLDINAADAGEVGYGYNDILDKEPPFEPLELDDKQEEENEKTQAEVEAAPKKRRLRGKQAAPVYGPAAPLPPAAAAAGVAALAGQRRRTRPPRPNEICPGRNGEPCSWSSTQLGEPAGLHTNRGQTACAFCGDEQLNKVLAQQNGFQLTKTLKALRELHEVKYEAALENLKSRKGEAFAADFGERVDFAIYRAVEQARAPARRIAERWEGLLQRRARIQGPLKADALETYEQGVRRDRMMIQRKIFARDQMTKRYNRANEEAELARMPLPPTDIAPNDCGLPGPTSERAKMAEAWCKHGSWQICEACGSVRPRPFQPVDLRVRQPTIKKCLLCRRGVYVPQPEDVPEPVRNLPNEVLAALRPLEVDSGRYEKAEHGYRVHATMVRFAWAAESVGAKIRALRTHELRSKARNAFRFLAQSDDSAYGEFIDKHEEFLERHPRAPEHVRKRPLRFIEEQGLENASVLAQEPL